MTQSPTESFRPNKESFDNLYRGEPAFPGGPPPGAIPWDVGQAQPRLMELEALGAINGEVLDIGCGLGDNAIFLASSGHSVTGLDGSTAAIDRARARAADAGQQVRFDVADATELAGHDGAFDTVIDSALLHCLDDDGRRAYAAALHRATRPGARWFISCFSDGNVNGVITPMGAVPEDVIRDTLAAPAGASTSWAPPPISATPRDSPGAWTDCRPRCSRRCRPSGSKRSGRRASTAVPRSGEGKFTAPAGPRRRGNGWVMPAKHALHTQDA